MPHLKAETKAGTHIQNPLLEYRQLQGWNTLIKALVTIIVSDGDDKHVELSNWRREPDQNPPLNCGSHRSTSHWLMVLLLVPLLLLIFDYFTDCWGINHYHHHMKKPDCYYGFMEDLAPTQSWSTVWTWSMWWQTQRSATGLSTYKNVGTLRRCASGTDPEK